MLRVEDVHFQHGEGGPSYRFDLTAGGAEIVALMGASGSGKSTLLDILAGFLKPAKGALSWAGETFHQLPPEHRPCTVLFQSNNTFGHLSAAANVALGLPKLTPASPMVQQALADVGLSDQALQRAQTLSGGQQQRVALARSLVRRQPILLLDEPFTGLDDATRHALLPLVRQMADERGHCVLMVTHDLDDAQRIADRLLVVEEGVLVEKPL